VAQQRLEIVREVGDHRGYRRGRVARRRLRKKKKIGEKRAPEGTKRAFGLLGVLPHERKGLRQRKELPPARHMKKKKVTKKRREDERRREGTQ